MSAPTLTTVSIASNNPTGETTKAKTNNEITLSLTSDIAINEPVVVFQSGGAAITDTSIIYASTDNLTWTAKYTTYSTDTDGAITFTINFASQADSTAGVEVTTTTDSSAVTYDSITLEWANVSYTNVYDKNTTSFEDNIIAANPTVELQVYNKDIIINGVTITKPNMKFVMFDQDTTINFSN